MLTMSDRNEPFAYGDGTLMQLREQRWDLDEEATRVIGQPPQDDPEMGTQIIAPTRRTDVATATVPTAAAVSDDPLVRIEHRLDELTRAMMSMQRRLDSIDAALARVLAR